MAAKLGAERDPWARGEILRRVLTGPPLRFPLYDRRNDDLLRLAYSEQDPELLCWMIAQRLTQAKHESLPQELEPYRDRADLQERHAARERQLLARDLLAWASNKKIPTVRSLRFVWTLERRSRDGFALANEARLTSGRFNDEPRTYEQLRQLLSEVERKPGTLPSDQQVLLASYFEATTRFGLGSGFGDTLVNPAVAVAMLKSLDQESAAMIWATDIPAELSARAGITPDTPLRFSSQPVRVLPSANAVEDGARLELICASQNGQQRSLASRERSVPRY